MQKQSTVGTSATATERVRPELMLVYLRIRATEATLELGLTTVKKRAEDAAHRLTRLGASWTSVGEPYEDDQASADPIERMQRLNMARNLNSGPAPRRGVNVTLTASWDITDRTTEEVLLLADQLRFEAAADEPPDDPTPDTSESDDPQKQIMQMMAQTVAPREDVSPKFLYVVRPGIVVWDRLTATAYAMALPCVERMARAVGRRLGEPFSISYSSSNTAKDIMLRQRLDNVLASGDYIAKDDEFISDDPRAVEIHVQIHIMYHLESPATDLVG